MQQALFQYVFDSSSLINIEMNGKMAFLRKRRSEILIPEKVKEEIYKPPSKPLYRFIKNYPSVVTPFLYSEAEEYLKIRSQIGIEDGEAAAIATSIKRKLPLIIEDKKARAKAENHGVECHNWQEFLSSSS